MRDVVEARVRKPGPVELAVEPRLFSRINRFWRGELVFSTGRDRAD